MWTGGTGGCRAPLGHIMTYASSRCSVRETLESLPNGIKSVQTAKIWGERGHALGGGEVFCKAAARNSELSPRIEESKKLRNAEWKENNFESAEDFVRSTKPENKSFDVGAKWKKMWILNHISFSWEILTKSWKSDKIKARAKALKSYRVWE